MQNHKILVILLNTVLITEVLSRSGLIVEDVPPLPPSPPPSPAVYQLQKCRDGCLEQHAADEFTCSEGTDCLMNGFLTYNFKTFPVALYLMCWNQCVPETESNDINHMVFDEWPLTVGSMVRHQYLVNTEITWPKQIPPIDCLVTWEVLGGGLMGSLVTETADVELSLWPDTKYNIQVTCKNKETKQMSRSLLLTLDTKHAKDGDEATTPTTTLMSEPTTTTTISNEIPIEPFDEQDIKSDEIVINDNSIQAHRLHSDKSLHEYETSSSLLGIRITLISSQRLEYILGVTSAFVIFVFVVLVIVLKRRNIRQNAQNLARMASNGTTQLIVDKQLLLEHECIPQVDHLTMTIKTTDDLSLRPPTMNTGNSVRISY
ncbi:uncharacterized protein LOC134835030 [Culicoides brevitarsis]|uniref:uncharacterized protein LOC134835030 n=1 Tax=Culicoides brevitarsis TaxID=469753 RepID=UPI00307B277F